MEGREGCGVRPNLGATLLIYGYCISSIANALGVIIPSAHMDAHEAMPLRIAVDKKPTWEAPDALPRLIKLAGEVEAEADSISPKSPSRPGNTDDTFTLALTCGGIES